jgi:GNAT superfamily N-acetyltransferase
VEIRTIDEDDFHACIEIFTESWNDLHLRYGYEDDVSDDDSWLLNPLRHFLRTDPSGGRVAADDAGPIAFGSCIERDRYWFLSFLFVRPRAQGRGVGRRLLHELLPEDSDVVRATEVESFQSIATALYASAGMAPCAVKCNVSGPGRADDMPLSGPDLVRGPISEDDAPVVDMLDEQVIGFRRPEDHRWWNDRMTGLLYRRGREAVGYAYVDNGYIAPALAIDEATLTSIVADIARTADQPSQLKTAIWGTSGALLSGLLRAGWRIEESRYTSLYLSSRGPLPPNYISHAGWLP